MAIANISKAMWETGLEAANSPTVNFLMQDNGGQVHAGGNNWPLRGNSELYGQHLEQSAGPWASVLATTNKSAKHTSGSTGS
jgi:hypothetical protein